MVHPPHPHVTQYDVGSPVVSQASIAFLRSLLPGSRWSVRTCEHSMKSLSLILAFTASLAAQQLRDTASLLRDLASKDARAVAAAATGLRVKPTKTLSTPLQEALDYWCKQSGDRAAVVRLRLLDTLLATKARVPPKNLLPLIDDRWAMGAVLALLARDRTSNQAELFRVFETMEGEVARNARSLSMQQDDLKRIAIGNMLAADKIPAFCRLLLRNIDLDLEVVVSPSPGGPLSFEVNRPESPPMCKELGPTPVHTLGSGPTGLFCPQGTKHVLGVTLTRVVWKPKEPIFIRMESGISPAVIDGAQWLTMMSECKVARPLRKIEIELGNAEFLKKRVRTAKAKLQAFVDGVFAGLIENKCLTKEEAEAIPHTVKLHIRDLRKDQNSPLPDFAEPAKSVAPR